MIELRAGTARAQVAPDRGAALAGLWAAERPVLRPLRAGQADNPFAYAMNVLAPFSNRISGAVPLDGRRVSLAPNLAGEPYPIHGDAFQRAWRVADGSTSAVRLVIDEGAFGPFRYAARLDYRLEAGGLAVRLALRNTADATLPFGGGFHPWFPRDAATRIAFSAAGWWPEDDRHLPAGQHPAALPEDLRFDEPRLLPDGWINAGFAAWPGRARLLQGPAQVSVAIDAPDLTTLIVYSPGTEADFVCVEPVSHPVDAHNLPGQPGLRPLAPGEETAFEMRLDWRL